MANRVIGFCCLPLMIIITIGIFQFMLSPWGQIDNVFLMLGGLSLFFEIFMVYQVYLALRPERRTLRFS